MKKALMFIEAYIGDFSKFIKKYKDVISKLDTNFEIYGYKYTLESNISDNSSDIIDDLLKEFNSAVSGIDSITKLDITNMRKNYTSSAYKDKLRGDILGKDKVSESLFLEEVKSGFRDGASDKENITVKSDTVSESMLNYIDNKTLLKSARKDRDNTIRLLDSIKVYFSRGASLHVSDEGKRLRSHTLSKNTSKIDKRENTTNYGTDELVKINILYNAQFSYAKFVSAIITTALSEKVNAIKESMTQDKLIIRGALKNKNKEVREDD